ncbi:hypothetical protein BGZ46_003186 [Entomortierella lignicola]|nr:hypothetical protein BGZ46_003186 [Entomortierella lignicola]
MDADPLQFSRALERCLELRELVFDRIHESMMKIYPAAILACQRLESLVVMGQVFDAREVMNAILSKHASTIKRIKWTGGGGFSGGLDLQVFLRSCPNLERLETTFGDLYSYTDQGAIGGLRIRDEPLPTSQATITVSTPLLDSTNNKDPSTLALDELSPDNLDLSALTIEESSNTTTVVECTASSINSSSSSAHTSTSPTLPPSSYWPCRATLTYLDVSFYPDREISDEKQFRDQIEHAYQKIGQLHELVTLHLGCECRCEGPHLVFCTHSRWDYEHGDPAIIQPPAPLTQAVVEEQLSYFPTSVLLAGAQDGVILDFSLATGLEHLSDLKKLELVNISKIKGHKVGYAELEWMKENWPQLKEFYGTRNKNLQNWIQEHWSGLRV